MKRKLNLKNNLKKYRKEKKLSQAALANMIGVTRNAITSIERYEYCPTAALAGILCMALEVPFEELFYFEESRSELILTSNNSDK